MRIQHINNAVSAEVLVQRDGPFEPVVPQAYSEPVYAEPVIPEQTYAAPTYSTPAYSASSAAYSESAVVAAQPLSIAPEKQPISAVEAVPSGQVASDLAALLWEGLGDVPS
jgi:hypothetical protein